MSGEQFFDDGGEGWGGGFGGSSTFGSRGVRGTVPGGRFPTNPDRPEVSGDSPIAPLPTSVEILTSDGFPTLPPIRPADPFAPDIRTGGPGTIRPPDIPMDDIRTGGPGTIRPPDIPMDDIRTGGPSTGGPLPPGVPDNPIIELPCSEGEQLSFSDYGLMLNMLVFQWKTEADAYLRGQNFNTLANQTGRYVASLPTKALDLLVDYKNFKLNSDGLRYSLRCENVNAGSFTCSSSGVGVTQISYTYISDYNIYLAKFRIEGTSIPDGDYYIGSDNRLCRLVLTGVPSSGGPTLGEDNVTIIDNGAGGTQVVTPGGTAVVNPPATNTPIQTKPRLGTGMIYHPINSDDIKNIKRIDTAALWSKNQKYLQTPSTASLDASGSVNYILHVYNADPNLDECAEIQYNIVYADYEGKGDIDLGGLDNETVTKAMYTQYAHILLPHQQEKFIIDGQEQDYVYIIDVKRDRYKTVMDAGNWQLTIASASFSVDSGNSVLSNLQTGSFVSEGLTFVDTSLDEETTLNRHTRKSSLIPTRNYEIKLGTLEDGLFSTPSGATTSETGSFGIFYPNHGILVLSGAKLDAYLGFNTNRNIERNGFNAYRLHHAIKLVTENNQTDASGDPLGFYGRYVDIKYVDMCFIRVKNSIFNYSNNPTYIKNSEGELLDNFRDKERAYFTSIGIYNSAKELLAIGKVSRSLVSSASDESLFTVKIEQ